MIELLIEMFISVYSLIMSLGRGYPLLAKYSPSWQILLTIDYRLFIFGIYMMKGAVSEMKNANKAAQSTSGPFRPGCLLWFGRFERATKAIGRIFWWPINSVINAFKML